MAQIWEVEITGRSSGHIFDRMLGVASSSEIAGRKALRALGKTLRRGMYVSSVKRIGTSEF